MLFGEKLKNARTHMDMSQDELAELIGVSRKTIYGYEQLGKLPRKDNLEKISEILQVSEKYLMNDSITDPGEDFNKEACIRKMAKEQEKEGRKRNRKNERELKNILDRTAALMAGGEIDEEAKDAFMESLTQVYQMSKQDARKFAPKTKREKK